MDVEKVRKDADSTKQFSGATWSAKRTADALLRILDAFDVMERERWYIDQFSDEHEGDVCQYWQVVGTDGDIIADGISPLAALLAAAEQTEKRDGD